MKTNLAGNNENQDGQNLTEIIQASWEELSWEKS